MTDDTVVHIKDAPVVSKREKLDLYCEGLANGLTQEKAYINAGYSPNSAKKNASAYHRANHEYIQAYLAEHIGSHAPTALNVILQIMNSESEKGGIRLKAAQDILDRAGFSAKQKVELSAKDPKDLTTEDIQRQIQSLLEDDPKLAKVFHLPVKTS